MRGFLASHDTLQWWEHLSKTTADSAQGLTDKRGDSLNPQKNNYFLSSSGSGFSITDRRVVRRVRLVGVYVPCENVKDRKVVFMRASP